MQSICRDSWDIDTVTTLQDISFFQVVPPKQQSKQSKDCGPPFCDSDFFLIIQQNPSAVFHWLSVNGFLHLCLIIYRWIVRHCPTNRFDVARIVSVSLRRLISFCGLKSPVKRWPVIDLIGRLMSRSIAAFWPQLQLQLLGFRPGWPSRCIWGRCGVHRLTEPLGEEVVVLAMLSFEINLKNPHVL